MKKNIYLMFLAIPFYGIIVSNHYRMIILSILFMGVAFSFLSCTKYLILKEKGENFLLNSYFDGLITEKVKTFNEIKSCTVSQRKVSINKECNFTDAPIQYDEEFYLRIFTENGILEPFDGSSSKEEIEYYSNCIKQFLDNNENSLILKQDSRMFLRYIGYMLILFLNIFTSIYLFFK